MRLTAENIRKYNRVSGAYELADRNKVEIRGGSSDGVTTGVGARLREHRKNFPDARYFRVRRAGLFNSGLSMEARQAALYKKKHKTKRKHEHRSPREWSSIFDW